MAIEKNLEKLKKKICIFCRVSGLGTRQRGLFAECLGPGTRQRVTP
jgi:hypothetical protein